MFRAYAYLGEVRSSVRITTSPVNTIKQANDLLDKLMLLEGASGGGIEVHVKGIGWVIKE